MESGDIFPSFLTSAPRWGELSVSSPSRLTPGIHCIGGWVGPRTGFGTVKNRTISYHCWEATPDLHPATELSRLLCEGAEFQLYIRLWTSGTWKCCLETRQRHAVLSSLFRVVLSYGHRSRPCNGPVLHSRSLMKYLNSRLFLEIRLMTSPSFRCVC
jgi:hypothetical protein